MLLIAWNIHNNLFSRFCLPGLTLKAITLFIHIEIKSCKTPVLLKVYKNILTDLPAQLQEQRIITSPQGLASTKNSATTSHILSPFSMKETWILTCVRWPFGTIVCHFLGLVTFWIKLLFFAPRPSLSIVCPVMGRAARTWTW